MRQDRVSIGQQRLKNRAKINAEFAEFGLWRGRPGCGLRHRPGASPLRERRKPKLAAGRRLNPQAGRPRYEAGAPVPQVPIAEIFNDQFSMSGRIPDA